MYEKSPHTATAPPEILALELPESLPEEKEIVGGKDQGSLLSLDKKIYINN